jgi:hypothetical protein
MLSLGGTTNDFPERNMRYTLIFLIPFILFNCSYKKEPQGVNFMLKDNGDSLSYFYYHGHKKYAFLNPYGKGTAFTNKELISKIPGEFIFGIRDRVGDPNNRFLLFQQMGVSVLPATDRPQIPFLDEEFEISRDFYVELVENYVDSLENPLRKYEVFAAIDKSGKDTILFQEAIFLIHDKKLYTSFITYDNMGTREEMKVLLDDAVKAMKESIK